MKPVHNVVVDCGRKQHLQKQNSCTFKKIMSFYQETLMVNNKKSRIFSSLRYWLVAMLVLLFFSSSSIMAQQTESAAPQATINLTQEERAWLAENHTVRVRISVWPPYMITEPVPSGVSVDYLTAIAKRFGFKVQFVTDSIGWTKSMQDVKGDHHYFDLLTTMARTPEREKEFVLTDDYLSAPWVLYTRNDHPYISGPESLDGKTVASEKGYLITGKLHTDYPNIHILEVATSLDALEAVATGRADAYVGNLAISNFLIKENRLSNLVVAAPTPFGLHKQSMAIRKDWPVLASLINKGLAAMTAEELYAINQKWGAVEIRPRTDYKLVWQTFSGAGLVLLAFFYWSRRLAREIAVRKRIEIELIGAKEALTEEKHLLIQAQQELQQLNQTLEDQVRHRTLELESVNSFNETILLNSPLPMGVYAATGQCILANDAYAQLVGATREALMSQNFRQIESWRATGLLDCCLAALEQHRQQQGEMHVVSSFGKDVWIEYRVLPTYLNGIEYILIQYVDLTERKLADEKLLKLSRAVEQSQVTIVVADLLGNIEFVNPVFTKLTGYSAEEAIGLSTSTFKSGKTPPETYKELWQAITAGNTWEGELFNKGKNGNLFWEHVTISPVRDANGVIIHYLAVKEDITEKKYIQGQLVIAKEQAEAANRAKSDFLANMSHEIRTPMNGIIGMNSLLLESKLTDEQRHYAKIVHDSAESLLNLINDILDFSKIEVGKLELEVLDFDLFRCMDDFMAIMAMHAEEKGLELRCNIEQKVPPLLCGDPSRLKQILTNLVGNAVKFTRNGSVTICVTLVENETRLHFDNEVLLRFAVRDTGIGIPHDKRERLFNKFSQVDPSTTREYGGSGLGLAISRQLSEMMGGEIGVNSEEGQGSEFWFTVCFRKQKGGMQTVALLLAGVQLDTINIFNGCGARILLAEDNEINQQVALGILENMGLCVDVVSNGAEALQALTTIQYDLLLTDVQMPVMDGFELASNVRNPMSAVLNHNIPIIAMTARAMQRDKDMCFAAGMNDYLTKPLMPQTIAVALKKYLITIGSENKCLKDQSPLIKLKKTEISEAPIWDKAGIMERLSGDIELVRAIVAPLQSDIPRQFQAKGDFLSNISHEIRTPMNAIIGFAQLALESGLNPVQERYLSRVHSSSLLLLTVFDNILDYVRIKASSMQLKQEEFRLNDLLLKVSHLFETSCEAKGLDFSVTIAEEVPHFLLSDQSRLEQVLINLVGNAVKFTEHGEIAIYVDLTEAEGRGEDRLLRFTIRDTGIGISEEALERLFLPFVQGDGTVSRQYGGTGLGLSIAKGLVEVMGGGITVSSSPGKWSSFVVTVRFAVSSTEDQQNEYEGLTDMSLTGAIGQHQPVSKAPDGLAADGTLAPSLNEEAFAALQMMLETNSFKALKLFRELRPALEGRYGVKFVERIAGAIEGLRFGEVISLLQNFGSTP